MTTKIYICSNDETLTDGYFLGVGDELGEEASEIFDAGVSVVRDDQRVDFEGACIFRDWHGGKHARCGVKVGQSETRFGYSAGWVVTHEANPPKWLCELCDKAAQAMHDKATELGERQANELAQYVIDAIGEGDEPSQFIIDNLSRGEVEPELLAKMEAAIEKFQSEQD